MRTAVIHPVRAAAVIPRLRYDSTEHKFAALRRMQSNWLPDCLSDSVVVLFAQMTHGVVS
jgi:hypothetical protein